MSAEGAGNTVSEEATGDTGPSQGHSPRGHGHEGDPQPTCQPLVLRSSCPHCNRLFSSTLKHTESHKMTPKAPFTSCTSCSHWADCCVRTLGHTARCLSQRCRQTCPAAAVPRERGRGAREPSGCLHLPHGLHQPGLDRRPSLSAARQLGGLGAGLGIPQPRRLPTISSRIYF